MNEPIITMSPDARCRLDYGKATTKSDTCMHATKNLCLSWCDLRPMLLKHSTHHCHSSAQLCSSDNVIAKIDDENSYIRAWPIANHPALEYSFGQSFLQGWCVHTNKSISTIDDPQSQELINTLALRGSLSHANHLNSQGKSSFQIHTHISMQISKSRTSQDSIADLNSISMRVQFLIQIHISL